MGRGIIKDDIQAAHRVNPITNLTKNNVNQAMIGQFDNRTVRSNFLKKSKIKKSTTVIM